MPVTVGTTFRNRCLALLFVLLMGCTGAGAGTAVPGSAAPGTAQAVLASPGSAAPATPHVPEAASSSIPEVGDLSADDALAAVIAQEPRLAGYRLVTRTAAASTAPGSPRFGPGPRGQQHVVLAERVADGMRLIFMTGTGDCLSGCTMQRNEVFLVHRDGSVVTVCVAERIPIGLDDPCRPG
jgi:hypothetical protein